MRLLLRKDHYHWALAALTETAVATPWLIWAYSLSGVSGWPDALPGAWLLLATYSAAGVWEAGAPHGATRGGLGRIVAMALGMAGIYLIAFQNLPADLRPDSPLDFNLALAVLPAAGYLWYQGAASAALGLDYGRVFDRFTTQSLTTVGAVLLLLLSGASRDERVQLLLYWSLLLLFGAGLTLLVVTRERSLREDQARLGEAGTGVDTFSPVVTTVISGMLLLTLVLSHLLSVERLRAVIVGIGAFLDRPFTWLVNLITLVLYPLGVIIDFLFYFLKRLVAGRSQSFGEQMTDVQPPPLIRPDILPESSTVDWTPYLKIGLLAGGALCMAALLLRLGHRVHRPEPEGDEERISLGFWKTLWTDLRAVGSMLRHHSNPAALAHWKDPESQDSRDPRVLFRRLQGWGAKIGRPRHPAETPGRYRRILAEQRPAADPAAGQVIAVYNQARYGAEQPDARQVADAAEAMANLRHL